MNKKNNTSLIRPLSLPLRLMIYFVFFCHSAHSSFFRILTISVLFALPLWWCLFWLCSNSLRQMEGIEYSVDPLSTEEFFLIRKSWRVDPNSTQLLALYLVIGSDHPNDPLMPPRGTVSPMPDLHTVLCTNLATAVTYLNEAFDGLAEHAKHHAAVTGYQWEFPQNTSATGAGANEEEKATDAAPPTNIAIESIEQQRRNPFSNLIDQAIMNLSKSVAMQTQGAQGGSQR